MTICPEAQKKAQSEIDTVIGGDRLPTAADREQLSYVNALCLEVLRWNPVVPIGKVVNLYVQTYVTLMIFLPWIWYIS